MADLLLELLSEEIPAGLQERGAEDLARLVGVRLDEARLSPAMVRSYATPRRLVLIADGLPAAQPDIEEERRGPRVGAPDAAIEGFLRSAGLARDALEERETPRGRFYFANLKRPGHPAADVLSGILKDVIEGFPWSRPMRWGASPLRWVRPLHAVLCLLDGKVVPLELPGGLSASDRTQGHRFMCGDSFRVTDAAQYVRELETRKVILDPARRRDIISEAARGLAESESYRLREDDGLVHENAGLVEWPVVLMGRIDEDFLDLPPEVLVSAMRAHQRYFALETGDGAFAPRFLMVANLEAVDGGRAIVEGNERVLRARLADARFFWKQDRTRPLESRLQALEGMAFHDRLGSMADKARRVSELAAELAARYRLGDPDLAARAGLLAKADLVTEMVGEFPDLQGIMGGYYAAHDGEDERVAQAISEHYRPQGPAGLAPAAPASLAVSLADKLDILAGFFGIGEMPTGSRDPFGLRRSALGVIRIILENGLRLPLGQVFDRALAIYGPLRAELVRAGETRAALLSFFADRLKVHLRGEGVRHDLISAVFALGDEDDLVRLLARVEAVRAFLDSEDGANLLIAFRRAANIVEIEEKRDGVRYDGAAEPNLLSAPEEKRLAGLLDEVLSESAQAAEAEDFKGVMAAVARLRAPVDAFFDRVTVNAEDPALRRNRLRLLARIRATLMTVADFSEIEG